MEGLSMKYRNINGGKTRIMYDTPQYLFLEPYDRVVVRYFLTKDGLEDSKTSITKQSPDTKLISVKFRYTTEPLISKIRDFDAIGNGAIETIEVEFADDDQEIYVDVLYESMTPNRLRVKVKIFSEGAESFENENTVSDGPDEYVRMSNIQIKHEAVYYTYIYRRKGRLQKYSGRVEYPILAQILKDRLFEGAHHVDFDYPRRNVEVVIEDNKWTIDPRNREIFKPDVGRKVYVTDEEIGDIIREHASIAEILGLLQTKDLTKSGHPLRRDAEALIIKCDRECSLPAASLTNTVDTRGG